MEWMQILDGALRIVAVAVPGLLAITSGKQTDEEAIAHMTETAKRMKVREDGGEWDEDLSKRKRRGHPVLTDGTDNEG